MLRQYEGEIQKRHLAINAANRALTQGLSYPEVYASLQMGNSSMPSFDNLAVQQFGEGVNSAEDINVRSTGDLNKYRGLLDHASRQAGLAGSRLEGLFAGGRSVNRPDGSSSGQPGGNGEGGGGQPGGDGSGDGGMGVGFSNEGPKAPMAAYSGPKLDHDMVKAQALRDGGSPRMQRAKAGFMSIHGI